MKPIDVARESLDALGKGPTFVPGLAYRFSAFLTSRLMPRRAVVKMMADTTKQMYGDRAIVVNAKLGGGTEVSALVADEEPAARTDGRRAVRQVAEQRARARFEAQEDAALQVELGDVHGVRHDRLGGEVVADLEAEPPLVEARPASAARGTRPSAG